MSRTQQLLDDPRQFRRSVIIVLSIAFLARFAVLAAFWPSWDWHNNIVPDQWNELAINLAEHRTFAFSDLPTSPTVMRGPLFPFFEVPLYLIFGENYVGWVITLLLLDLFSCFLLVVTVRNLWGQRASLFAGLLYAVSLALIYYTCKIMQVTSIIPFVVTWLYLITVWERNYFSRWVPLAIGVVSGLMILNKTVYLPVPPVAAIVLLWLNRSKVRQLTHIAPVALYLVTTFLVVAPWTYRNYIVTSGHVVPVQSMFWELFVQDVLYDDLDATVGHDRPDGQLLDYWMEKENAMVVAAGLSVTPPADARARWEMQREASFRVAGLEMLKNDPMKGTEGQARQPLAILGVGRKLGKDAPLHPVASGSPWRGDDGFPCSLSISATESDQVQSVTRRDSLGRALSGLGMG